MIAFRVDFLDFADNLDPVVTIAYKFTLESAIDLVKTLVGDKKVTWYGLPKNNKKQKHIDITVSCEECNWVIIQIEIKG